MNLFTALKVQGYILNRDVSTVIKTEVPTNSPQQEVPESHIAALLEHRFGDHVVYLPRYSGRDLDSLARKLGYIDRGGYLTRKGRALIARYYYI